MNDDGRCCFDCDYSLACSCVREEYSNQSRCDGNWRCVPEYACINNCLHFKHDALKEGVSA